MGLLAHHLACFGRGVTSVATGGVFCFVVFVVFQYLFGLWKLGAEGYLARYCSIIMHGSNNVNTSAFFQL